MMSNNDVNKNLLIGCSVLNRVESLLNMGTRTQLSSEDLITLGEYLTNAVKCIDSTIGLFNSQVILLGSCIEYVDKLAVDSTFSTTNSRTKEYLVNKINPVIIEFKVNVGRYLTDTEFEYTPAMDMIIKDIIEVCISNDYYFNY